MFIKFVNVNPLGFSLNHYQNFCQMLQCSKITILSVKQSSTFLNAGCKWNVDKMFRGRSGRLTQVQFELCI